MLLIYRLINFNLITKIFLKDSIHSRSFRFDFLDRFDRSYRARSFVGELYMWQKIAKLDNCFISYLNFNLWHDKLFISEIMNRRFHFLNKWPSFIETNEI